MPIPNKPADFYDAFEQERWQCDHVMHPVVKPSKSLLALRAVAWAVTGAMVAWAVLALLGWCGVHPRGF